MLKLPDASVTKDFYWVCWKYAPLNEERKSSMRSIHGFILVLLTRRESTWQQMVFTNALIMEKTIWLQPWSWSQDTNPKASKISLILLLMPSLFKCQMRLCFMRFNSNLSEINISEIIPFWICCLRCRSDQLWTSWGKPLKSIVKPFTA